MTNKSIDPLYISALDILTGALGVFIILNFLQTRLPVIPPPLPAPVTAKQESKPEKRSATALPVRESHSPAPRQVIADSRFQRGILSVLAEAQRLAECFDGFGELLLVVHQYALHPEVTAHQSFPGQFFYLAGGILLGFLAFRAPVPAILQYPIAVIVSLAELSIRRMAVA